MLGGAVGVYYCLLVESPAIYYGSSFQGFYNTLQVNDSHFWKKHGSLYPETIPQFFHQTYAEACVTRRVAPFMMGPVVDLLGSVPAVWNIYEYLHTYWLVSGLYMVIYGYIWLYMLIYAYICLYILIYAYICLYTSCIWVIYGLFFWSDI